MVQTFLQLFRLAWNFKILQKPFRFEVIEKHVGHATTVFVKSLFDTLQDYLIAST